MTLLNFNCSVFKPHKTQQCTTECLQTSFDMKRKVLQVLTFVSSESTNRKHTTVFQNDIEILFRLFSYLLMFFFREKNPNHNLKLLFMYYESRSMLARFLTNNNAGHNANITFSMYSNFIRNQKCSTKSSKHNMKRHWLFYQGSV